MARSKPPDQTRRTAPTGNTSARDAPPLPGPIIYSAADIPTYLPDLKTAEQEPMWVLGLNARHRVVQSRCVALGTVDRVDVSSRDVFRELVRGNCACFILVHNHPSADPYPSPQDEALTRKLAQGGGLLGIQILDHVIIAAESYYSFAEHGLLPATLGQASSG